MIKPLTLHVLIPIFGQEDENEEVQRKYEFCQHLKHSYPKSKKRVINFKIKKFYLNNMLVEFYLKKFRIDMKELS